MRIRLQDYGVSTKPIEPIFYNIPTVKKKILNVPFSVRLNQKYSASTVVLFAGQWSEKVFPWPNVSEYLHIIFI